MVGFCPTLYEKRIGCSKGNPLRRTSLLNIYIYLMDTQLQVLLIMIVLVFILYILSKYSDHTSIIGLTVRVSFIVVGISTVLVHIVWGITRII
jgi:hypothetical protein